MFRRLQAHCSCWASDSFVADGMQEHRRLWDILGHVRRGLGSCGGSVAMTISSVETMIKPEGQIDSQTGGTKSRGAAIFRIPLLALLRMDKPLDSSVSYR